MPTENGYSNQKKKGQSQFKTINQVGSNQFANPISQKTLFDKTPAAIAITAVADILGGDGQVEFWQITLPVHTASKNDLMRMITGTLLAWEYDIVQIVDANNFYILPISDTKPIVAETAKILGWTTSKSTQEGELIVNLLPAPILFVLDGVDTEVELDTAVPANSIGLPINQLNADGTLFDTQYFVDTELNTNGTWGALGSPADAVATNDTGSFTILSFIKRGLQNWTTFFGIFPASLGQKASAASLAVVLSTEQEAKIDLLATEVTLAAVLADTTSLDGKDFSTETTLAAVLTELQLKADLTETQPVSLASVPLPTGAATEVTLAAVLADTTSLDGKDFATEATLAAQSVKLPATIGQKASAASLAAVLSTEQEAILDAIKTAVETSATELTPSYQEIVNLTNSVQTFTAPANAKWAKVMADDTNTGTIRVKIGAAATVSSGMQFQPGRSEDYQAVGDISVICETSATNQKIYVQFGV